MEAQTTPLDHSERERLLARIQTLEEQLEHQAQSFAALLDASPDLIVHLDVNGTILHVNRRMAQRLLVAPDAAKTTNLFDCLPPELAAHHRACALEAMATTTPVHFVDRSGGRVFANRFYPVASPSGAVSALAVFSTDITERQHQEERLRLLLEHSSDALIVIDGDGRQRYVSPGAERITGYAVAQLEGRTIATLIHPEDLDRVMAAWTDVLQHPDRTVTVQYRHIHQTRHWVSCEAIAQNLLGNPSINGVIATVRDISGQVQGEQALRHSQQLLSATQRLAKIGGWEWQLADQTMTWTEECFRIHGLTPDNQPTLSAELINHSLSCYRKEDRPTVLAAFRRCAEEGEPYDLQLPFRSFDGRNLWIRTMAEAVFEDGRIALVRGNILDITKENRLERLLAVRLRLSETYASLSLDNLLASVMNEAENLTDSTIGFFHFVNADQQTLTLQAWSQSTTTHFCKAEGKGLHYPLTEAGVWVDCLRQRTAVIHNDYESLPHRKGLPPGHALVIRELVVPVFRDSDIVAIFGVGNKEQDYDQDDIEMVTALGNLVWDIILRRRAEEELSQSEERFRTLLAGLPSVAIQGYKADGTVHYWNQASEQLYGYTAEEAIGRSLLELIIPPEMRSEVRLAIASMAESSQAFKAAELSLMRHDGTRVPVFSSHLVLMGRDGAPELFCVDIDLTESKRAAERLRLNEEQFRLSFERSPVGMVMLDTSSRFLRANEAFCQMLGYSEEELALLTCCDDITHPEERQRDLLQVQRLLAGDIDRYDAEKRYLHTNGDIIWARVSVALVRDGENTPLYFLSIILDITAQKKAELSLQESESRYQRIVDTAREGIWMINDQWRTTYVNEHMAAMLGLTPADMMGRPAEDFLFAEDLAGHEERMAIWRQEKGGYHELRFRHREGQEVWTMVSTTPLKDEGGRFTGSFAMFTNITERKKAEKRLLERNAYLQSILRTSPVGIGVVINRELREVNTRLCEITGYRAEDLLGQNARMLYPSEAEYRWVGEEKYAQIARHGTGTVETRWQRQDGRIIDILLSSTPIDVSDLSLGVTFSALDITDRKQAEQQVR